MGEFYSENRKKLITIGIIVLVTIVFSIFNRVIVRKGNNDALRKKNLKELGERYYTKILYPVYKDSLEKHADIGFRVTLYDISSKLDDDTDNIYDLFSDDKTTCDLLDTYLIIYPVYPYGKEDIEYKTTLSCNIDKGKVDHNED